MKLGTHIINNGNLTEDAFINACARGNVTEVRNFLIKKEGNPAADDNSAIYFAAYYGHIDVVKLLLADPRVNPADEHSRAPIVVASENGFAEIVKLLLLDKRVDPSADNNHAISYAVSNGHTDVVKLLLADPRIDPNAELVYGDHSIVEASKNGFTEIVKLLLADERVDPAINNNEAIRQAAAHGKTEVIRMLLADPRVDPNQANFGDALSAAVENCQIEAVRILLADPRIDPARYANSCIQVAVQKGNFELIKLLLADPRVNPAAQDNAAIKHVAKIGDLAVLLLLLEHPTVFAYVCENLIDFINNNKHVKNALNSSHNQYNEAFRNAFFSLISKEFLSAMPYYIAALHANGMTNDLITHNIAPVLHPFFAYYLNKVMSNDRANKVSADGIHLVNQSCMLLPIYHQKATLVKRIQSDNNVISQELEYRETKRPRKESNTMLIDI